VKLLSPEQIVFLLLLVVLSGCQSRKITHYTSPEITGRVLAADTHQPLADVRVQRGGSQNFEPFGPPKGGQLLMQTDGMRTDADGRFVLGSKSVFALLFQPGWWSVRVTYSHYGYESYSTNYTCTNVTSHTDAGAPVVNAGDVLLPPAAH
jgi:hypothetical protein